MIKESNKRVPYIDKYNKKVFQKYFSLVNFNELAIEYDQAVSFKKSFSRY